ncbi:SHOCT domain-containing protein [Bacillus solitudinis]|uniref:SHOCT domain-containing protein n=1 Tax=Bacillus solitudinis TaxID=2014074 RepID=UPI000C23D658|nr:SHOCT domain-containing protein [Bacillus solitudinis]
MMNAGMMNIGMILFMIFLIIIFGFIIYGIVSLITKLINKDNMSVTSQNEEDVSLQILKERFAEGELTESEFEQKYALLKEKK